MYIRQLRIDQFGACADFEISSLAPGLTVIHGPRGAGKSTIAAFLQGALFGYDTPLAARFLDSRFADSRSADSRIATDRVSSTWGHERFAARDSESRGPRSRPALLGGSLSLTLPPTADRARDTRRIERHHNGDAERLRLSRLAADRDTRSDFDPQDERGNVPLNPAAIDSLYAGFPAQFLSELFVLDFEHTTRLGALLEQAERHGVVLVDSVAHPTRVQELESELSAVRDQRAATVDPGATFEALSVRRAQLVDEIAELENRARHQQGERARWRNDLATLATTLERQLANLTRDIEALDAALATLVERRRHLAAATRSASPIDARDPAVREEIQKLDEQLDRWRRTLSELITAKGHSAELAEASDRMLASGAATEALGLLRRVPGALFGLADAELAGLPAGDPLRRLAELEASAFAISELLAKAQALLRDHAPPLVAADLAESLERHHQSLRGQTRQLAESLSGWRHWITKRAAADEQQQLLRSEIEFRRAIAALEERRQKLLGKTADPAALPIAAHTDSLDECQRMMERRDAALRRRQETARQLSETQRLLAETSDAASLGRTAAGANPRLADEAELRQGGNVEADGDAAAIDRQLRELRLRAARGSFDTAHPGDSGYSESIASQIDAKRSQIMRLERDLAVADRRRELARRCEELERQLDEERARRASHPVLREASDFLAQVTDGRLIRIARDHRGFLRVEAASGERLEWDALAEAAQDQIVLAMHVTLAREFRRRGVQLPLIVNEPFARYADRELPTAIRYLQRLADEVQILCLTGDERAARAARLAGVALGWLRVDADGRPALFDAGRSATEPLARPAVADAEDLSLRSAASPTARSAAMSGAMFGGLSGGSSRDDDFAAPRAAWGVRRPHAWDSEEFPGELADRRRFADPPSRRDADIRSAAKVESGKGDSGRIDSGRIDSGRLDSGTGDSGKFHAGTSELEYLEAAELALTETPPRYLLNRAELAAHAPSISGLLAQRLEDRGVRTVGDLLAVNADTLALLLGDVSAKAIRGWQTQAELACRVPGLRATDCRILAGLQVTSVEKLAALKPAELWKRVSQASDSGDWDRIAPGVSPPDPTTISNWIHAARRARSLAAA